MTTITQSNLIEQQKAVIDQYKLVLESYKTTRSKMLDLLVGIHELLTMDVPEATELGIQQLNRLIDTLK